MAEPAVPNAQFWIVAGPNGSGKSTLIRHGRLEPWTGPGIRALSPDDLVPALRQADPTASEETLVRIAQERSDRSVDEALAAGRRVMVETVLSSKKFELPVLRAIKAGYLFGFAYVIVRSAAVNIGRVADRVEEGGHDVPEDRIVARRLRSIAAVPWFASRAHAGVILDNTGAVLKVLAEKRLMDKRWTAFDRLALTDLGIDADF